MRSRLPEVGQIIGEKYRLERLLGQGGMGAVFEAVHIHIGSKSAIKFLHPGFSENQEAVRRFQREAQAAAAIGHDAIIKVHDIGVAADGSHYIVLEFLNGRSLGDMLAERGRLSVQETAYTMCQVLSGLSAAHQAGIVHRDLKPDNIYLVDTGALLPGVKVLDFGISRVTTLASDDSEYTRLTRTGIVLGTPAYMSPEHARGRSDIDHRSDLFSVGVILYEMLTGDIPFDGANYNAVLAQILTEEARPPRDLCPEIPQPMEDIIMRALTKNREQRYTDARELFDDLLPFVEDTAVGRISMPMGSAAAPVPPTVPALNQGRETDSIPARAVTLHEADRRGRLRSGALIAALVVALIGAIVGGSAVGLGFFGDDGEAEVPSETSALIQGPTAADDSVSELVNDSAEPSTDSSGTEGENKVATVTIRLEGVPEEAEVFLDGAPVPELPLLLAKGSPMRVLKVELPEHQSYKQIINPSRDQTITVELTPNESPSKVGRHKVGRTGGRGRPGRGRNPRGRSDERAGSKTDSRPYRPAFID